MGTVLIRYDSTSPAKIYGGSWTQITGRFLRAANDVQTGGSDTHTHSNPSTNSAGAHTHWWGATTGGGGSHNHGLGDGYARWAYTGGAMYMAYKGVNTWTANYGMTGGFSGRGGEWGLTEGVKLDGYSTSVGNHTHRVEGNTNQNGAHTHTQGNTGSASSMPKYQDVYVWRRTA